MTRGTRLVVVALIDEGDEYRAIPLREGAIEGHPVGDPSRVWVRWLSGREGLQLMRTEEAQRWVWRTP